jgi:hypothetical protein
LAKKRATCADGKRGADQAERQSEQQELPKLFGVARKPNRDSATQQQHKHDDPAAEPIRPDAKR